MNTRVWGLCVIFALGAGCGDDNGQSNNNNNNNNENANPPVCGNGELEAGEQCDDGAANSDTAADACRADCRRAFCGDAVLDASELCDTDELDGTACVDLGLGYTGGTLTCAGDCTFDDAECTECGDGVREGAEACDGLDVGSANCSTETGLQEGVVSCNADCTLDTSACHTCGDGQVQSPSEQCEDDDVGGLACEDMGYVWGVLRCTDCRYDTTGCHSDCGNGVAEAGEECDASDFAGRSCGDYGFTGGQLGCSAGCLVTIADCSRCGNGAADPDEECDGADLRGTTCASLSGGVMTGSLSCTAGCTLDTSACVAPVSCGNDQKEVGESCDGTDLPVTDCAALRPDVYGGGALSCQSNCLYDVSACTPVVRCGNGVRESDYGEQCDGQDLGGASCIQRGYAGGQLTCTASCAYDESACLPALTCGNDTKEPGEACDGPDLSGQTCVSLGYIGGNLSCSSQCTLDKAQCETCGDGIINGDDECDGVSFGSVTCGSLGYYGGSLTCESDCTRNITDCEANGWCGDGIRNGGELCDGADLNSQACTGLGFFSGDLACNTSCDGYDVTDCSYETVIYVNGYALNCPGLGTQAEPFCTIGDALAVAQPGNVIQLLDGAFTEEPVVTTPDLTIRGLSHDPSLVSLTGSAGPAITIDATGVSIQDVALYFEGPGGLLATDADGLELRNISVRGQGTLLEAAQGMRVTRAVGLTLDNVRIESMYSKQQLDGLILEEVHNAQLSNLDFSTLRGIPLRGLTITGPSSDITLQDVSMTGLSIGTHWMHLKAISIEDVTQLTMQRIDIDSVTSPVSSSAWGVALYQIDGFTAEDVDINNLNMEFSTYGLSCHDCSNGSLERIHVSNLLSSFWKSNCVTYGIWLQNANGVAIENSTVQHLEASPGDPGEITAGVYVENSNSVTIRGTEVDLVTATNAAAVGIEIDDCSTPSVHVSNTLVTNISGENTVAGARILNSSNVRAENVTIDTVTSTAAGAAGVLAGSGTLVARVSNSIITNVSDWGLYNDSSNTANDLGFTYSIVYGCSGGVHSNASDIYENQTVDPLYIDPSSRLYCLQSTSPGIDAGNPISDYSNEPQPNGGRINVGYCGNTPQATNTP